MQSQLLTVYTLQCTLQQSAVEYSLKVYFFILKYYIILAGRLALLASHSTGPKKLVLRTADVRLPQVDYLLWQSQYSQNDI